MDPATIAADVAWLVTILNDVVTAYEDAKPFIVALYNLTVKNQPLSDADRAALQTQETALRAQLNAPSIPADQA